MSDQDRIRGLELERDLLKEQLNRPVSEVERNLLDYIATINLNVPEQYRQPQLDLSMVRMRDGIVQRDALVERLRAALKQTPCTCPSKTGVVAEYVLRDNQIVVQSPADRCARCEALAATPVAALEGR